MHTPTPIHLCFMLTCNPFLLGPATPGQHQDETKRADGAGCGKEATRSAFSNGVGARLGGTNTNTAHQYELWSSQPKTELRT